MIERYLSFAAPILRRWAHTLRDAWGVTLPCTGGNHPMWAALSCAVNEQAAMLFLAARLHTGIANGAILYYPSLPTAL